MRFYEEWILNIGYFGLIASKVTRNPKTWPTSLFCTGKPLASGAQIYARIMIKK